MNHYTTILSSVKRLLTFCCLLNRVERRVTNFNSLLLCLAVKKCFYYEGQTIYLYLYIPFRSMVCLRHVLLAIIVHWVLPTISGTNNKYKYYYLLYCRQDLQDKYLEKQYHPLKHNLKQWI